MDELLDILIHPSRWATDANALRDSTRIYLALLIFGLTVLAAFGAGALSARWAHRRTGAGTSERNERTITRLRRGFIALFIAIGSYLAVEMAPLPERIDGWLSGITFVAGAIICARLVIQLVALLLTSSVMHVGGSERARLEREYVPLAEKATSLAVSFIVVIVVAKHFGKDVTSLVAALGVGSLAIGLAAQQTLGNMIAGFVLLVDRPFRPGERVRLATSEVGEVVLIGVRSTRIRLLDGNLLTVPNSELANSRVVTYAVLSAHSDVKITIALGSDVDRASALLAAVAVEDAKVQSPSVRVSNVTPQGIELTVSFDSASAGEQLKAEHELRRRAITRLQAERIGLPDLYKSSQGVPSGSPS
ncbi:MAG TPA: mechanosensitive ion channel family protein [Polyangia bacterium]|jgi:small-conductance mechanosensitive channel